MVTNESEASSSDSENQFSFYVEGVTLTLVSLFGLFGNSLSIIILLRGTFRNSFSNLLRGLAFCDALFLMMAILSFGLPKLCHWYVENIFIHVTGIMFGLLHTFRVGSVYVTMAVTLERFMAVIFPFRAFRQKRFLFPGSLCFAIIYTLPKYFEVETVWNAESQSHLIVSTALRQNPLYLKYYVIWSKLLITEIFPYLTILILNIFIIYGTLRASSFRKQFVDTSGPPSRRHPRRLQSPPTGFPGRAIPGTSLSSPSRTHLVKLKGHYIEPSSSSLAAPVEGEGEGKGKGEGKGEAALDRMNVVSSRSNHRVMNHPPRRSPENAGKVENAEGEMTELKEILVLTKSCSRTSHAVLSSSSRRPSVHSTHSSSLIGKRKTETDLARVLIGLSILFIICQSLKIIPDLYELFVCDTTDAASPSHQPCEVSDFVQLIVNMSHLLVCVNSSANFLFYFLHGAKFRRAFKDTFFCKSRRPSSVVSQFRQTI